MGFQKVKSKSKKLFWDSIFKGLLFGGVFALNKWVSYNKSDLPMPHRLKQIPVILRKTLRERGFHSIKRTVIGWSGDILMHFLIIDTAYSGLFEAFIKKYNEEMNCPHCEYKKVKQNAKN